MKQDTDMSFEDVVSLVADRIRITLPHKRGLLIWQYANEYGFDSKSIASALGKRSARVRKNAKRIHKSKDVTIKIHTYMRTETKGYWSYTMIGPVSEKIMTETVKDTGGTPLILLAAMNAIKEAVYRKFENIHVIMSDKELCKDLRRTEGERSELVHEFYSKLEDITVGVKIKWSYDGNLSTLWDYEIGEEKE